MKFATKGALGAGVGFEPSVGWRCHPQNPFFLLIVCFDFFDKGQTTVQETSECFLRKSEQ